MIYINPNYAYAYYALALAYESEGNKVKAIESYQKFVSLEKDPKSKQAVIDKINSLK